jgi:hypothetical protein
MEQVRDRYVNDVEAAKILSSSPQTLRNWRHLGRGPAYTKKYRMVRYHVGDLLDFMGTGRINPEGRREAGAAGEDEA